MVLCEGEGRSQKTHAHKNDREIERRDLETRHEPLQRKRSAVGTLPVSMALQCLASETE